MSKIVVYSAITGDRDHPRSDIPMYSGYTRFRDSRMNAKAPKILPHLFFDADWSVWVDGNVTIHAAPEQLVDLAEGNDIAVFDHPWRDCIYQEAEECIRHKLDSPTVIRKQIARYKRSGFPENSGLAMCGIIIRRHTDEVLRLCERWWAEICCGSVRDQLSFPVVFEDSPFIIPGNPYKGHWAFNVKSHKIRKPPLHRKIIHKTRLLISPKKS